MKTGSRGSSGGSDGFGREAVPFGFKMKIGSSGFPDDDSSGSSGLAACASSSDRNTNFGSGNSPDPVDPAPSECHPSSSESTTGSVGSVKLSHSLPQSMSS